MSENENENEEGTVDTNAGDDAVMGTVADQDVEGTAPHSHAEDEPETAPEGGGSEQQQE